MTQVPTVRGPVDTADLGPVYMHEHIFVLTADIQQNYPAGWGSEDDRIAEAVAKLRALAAQGVRTIVDPAVTGLGRYLPRIQRIAEQVPELNIDWIDPNVRPFLSQCHYLHIHDEVLPYAREHGVTQEQIAATLTGETRSGRPVTRWRAAASRRRAARGSPRRPSPR